MEYTKEESTRASHASGPPLPAAYDEKDDHSALKRQLARRKKPVYAGIAFLCLVVIGVSIGVATGGSSSASNQAAQNPDTPAQLSPEQAKSTTPSPAQQDAAEPESDDGGLIDITEGASGSGSVDASSSNLDDSVAGESSRLESGSSSSNASTAVPITTSPAPSLTPLPEQPAGTVRPIPDNTAAPTETPSPSPSDNEPLLPYTADPFDWLDISNWEYASGRAPRGDMFGSDAITLTSDNSPEPIRTKKGWAGEKIVLVEWERSGSSDTNIWMLNTKLQRQFAPGNGWPYWGELDIFEMFTQDAIDKSFYDFSGFGPFGDVGSYGQLTLHMGAPHGKGPRCFCPASPFKSKWYKDQAPLTSGCTAQFANTPTNSIATVFGVDGNGQYLQLIQNPVVKKGGKKGEVPTYDVLPGGGVVTPKIYNNAELFWGTPVSDPCSGHGGHNAATGFPFFEEFRLVLEEQKKGDGGAWFKVNNVQVFRKN